MNSETDLNDVIADRLRSLFESARKYRTRQNQIKRAVPSEFQLELNLNTPVMK